MQNSLGVKIWVTGAKPVQCRFWQPNGALYKEKEFMSHKKD